jgi:hypothetical protein
MREAEAARARVDGWSPRRSVPSSSSGLDGALSAFCGLEASGALLATLGRLTGEPRSTWKAVYGPVKVWLPGGIREATAATSSICTSSTMDSI